MGDIVSLHQERGIERTWVPKAEEAYWIAMWERAGMPAARWRDYVRWGHNFYPPTDSVERITLRPLPRNRRSHARKVGYR